MRWHRARSNWWWAGSPTPQKRPFIAYLKANFRGINPNSDLAAELRARGITQKDVPGLFARNGNAAWDNIVAAEHPEIAEAIPTVGDTLYLDPQAIAEAISGEVAGQPLAFGRHAAEQQAARDEARSGRSTESGQSEAVERSQSVIPQRERDPRTDEERVADITVELRAYLACGFRKFPDSGFSKSRTRVSVIPGQGFR